MRNYMKEKAKEMGLPETRVNGAGCLGECEKGPVVVVYPRGDWYRVESRADVDALLLAIAENRIEARLLITPVAET